MNGLLLLLLLFDFGNGCSSNCGCQENCVEPRCGEDCDSRLGREWERENRSRRDNDNDSCSMNERESDNRGGNMWNPYMNSGNRDSRERDNYERRDNRDNRDGRDRDRDNHDRECGCNN